LSDAISSCNCRLMGIEGFSRRKPVVVRTTPAGVVRPTRSGAGSRAYRPAQPAMLPLTPRVLASPQMAWLRLQVRPRAPISDRRPSQA
jgi:hypothetical protein